MDNQTPKNNSKRLVIGIVVLVVLAVVGIGSYLLLIKDSSKNNDDVSVSTTVVNQLKITFTAPANSTAYKNGEQFDGVITLNENLAIGAAELSVKYDQSVLKVISISEDSTSLGLNKKIDQTNGKVTIDLAKIGDGVYTSGSKLATVKFQVVSTSKSSTLVGFNAETRLGEQNLYNAANQGQFEVKIDSVTSSAICGDGIKNGTEICDGDTITCTTGDGLAGKKSCNSTCLNYSACIADSQPGGGNNGGSTGGGSNNALCKADYSKNKKVDAADLGTFSLNYKKQSIQCELDLVGSDCLLDLADLREFARNYGKDCPSDQTTGGSNGGTVSNYFKWWGSTSPFNNKIPSTATYTKDNEIGSIRFGYTVWSAPIYRLPANHSVPNVKITNTYSGRVENWPIPTTAKPAAESDAHMVVVDLKTKKTYEFWAASWQNGEIRAGGMKDYPLDGNAISNPVNYRVTASGFAVSGGMITREDFMNPQTGVLDPNAKINHGLAIALNFDKVKKGAFIAPAVGGETNGRSGDAEMGALYALPKTADVENMTGISPLTKSIAIALRDYGAFVNDTNATPKYNNKYIGTIRIEPGLTKELYNIDNDTMLLKVQEEMYTVIQKYGIYKVSGVNYGYTGI